MKAKRDPTRLTGKNKRNYFLKLFLVVSLLHLPSNVILSQNNLITADFVNAPLSEVLNGISQNCGVRVAFDYDLASGISVTLRLKNADADNALSLALQDTPLWYINVNDVYIIKLREEIPEEIVLPEPEITKIRIAGVVREAETREHLPYAGIQIEGTNQGTSANSDGYFTLITQFADSLKLTVSYIGYDPVQRLIHPADEEGFLVIEMKQRSDMLEVVEIVGKPHQEIIEVSDMAGRFAMNASRMQEIPSLNGLDVAAPLQILPGIDGTTERASGLSIRKAEPDKNLIIYDGFPIYHIDHFFGMFTAFNSKAIKDIRVHKSISDASLGGRTGGVIEITGKSGDMSGATFDAGIDLLSGNLFAGFPVGNNSSMVVTARRSFTDHLRTPLYNSLFNKISYDFDNTGNPPPGFMEAGPDESVYYFYDYTGKYTYKPTDKDIVSLSAYRGYDRMDFEKKITDSKSIEESDWGNRGGSFRWARKWSDSYYSNIVAGYSGYHLYFMNYDSLSRPQITPESIVSVNRKFELYNEVSDMVVNINNQVQVNNSNRVDFGLAYNTLNTDFIDIYRYITSRSTLADTITGETAESQIAALYLQNNYTNNRLGALNIGARLTAYQGDFYYEPRISATYNHLPFDLSVKMSYGTNNQFINRILVFEEGHPRFLWALSDGRRLPVVESRQFSGGLLWEPSPFLSVDAEFYNRKSTGMTAVQNHIRRVSGENGLKLIRTYYNYSNETTGMDLLVKTGFDPLRLWLAYTYSVSTDRSPQINNGSGYPSVNDQAHELKLLGVLSIKDWTLSSSFIFGSGKPWDKPLLDENMQPHPDYMKNSERLPPYHRMDLSISRTIRFQGYTLNTGLNIFNLYNHSNVISRPYSLSEDPLRSISQANSPFVFNEISGRGFAINFHTDIRF